MEQSHDYIVSCINTGILTKQILRKYPLSSANIAVVVKAYALKLRMPFIIDTLNFEELTEYRLYLTDAGLEWLIQEFKQYTLVFLRTAFQFVFSNATQKDIDNLEQYKGLNNFKGLIGTNYKVGTTHPALLVRTYGKNNKLKIETRYDTLVEARKEVLYLTRFYPAEQFTLYRLAKSKSKDVYLKYEVPLFLKENRRGVPINLPHLKGKL
jgi:hypothetical protein